MTLQAAGNLKIDRNGLLDGQLKTRVQNLNQLLSDLEQRGIITSKDAKGSATMLGLFNKGGSVNVDLLFKQGDIYWGPFKLGRQTPLF